MVSYRGATARYVKTSICGSNRHLSIAYSWSAVSGCCRNERLHSPPGARRPTPSSSRLHRCQHEPSSRRNSISYQSETPLSVEDVFRKVCEALEIADIPYMVTGSFASAIHGEPRASKDIDIVISPTREKLIAFMAQFPSGHYYAVTEDA